MANRTDVVDQKLARLEEEATLTMWNLHKRAVHWCLKPTPRSSKLTGKFDYGEFIDRLVLVVEVGREIFGESCWDILEYDKLPILLREESYMFAVEETSLKYRDEAVSLTILQLRYAAAMAAEDEEAKRQLKSELPKEPSGGLWNYEFPGFEEANKEKVDPFDGRYLLSFLFDKVCDLIQEPSIAGNNEDELDLSEWSISAKPKDWAKKVFDDVHVKTLRRWKKNYDENRDGRKLRVLVEGRDSWRIHKDDLRKDYEALLRRIDIS